MCLNVCILSLSTSCRYRVFELLVACPANAGNPQRLTIKCFIALNSSNLSPINFNQCVDVADLPVLRGQTQRD